MAAKRFRNAVLLSSIESTEGVEQSIAPSTDGIVVENCQVNFNEQNQQTDEVTGSLDGSEDVPIGGFVTITFDTYVKANGVAGTPPETGKLLKAAGWTETVSLNALPTAAATVQSTSGAGGLVAPAAFNGGDDAYKGMPILLSGPPTTPTFSLVTGFTDSGNVVKIAESIDVLGITGASMMQIPINVMYKPQSGTIPSLTQHYYLDGIKHILIGCRGSFKLDMESGKACKFSWTFQGILSAVAGALRSDVSNPVPTYPDIGASKLVWRNDNANGAFLVDGIRIGVTKFSFDNGTTLDNAPNPNQPAGFDVADIAKRVMMGDINPRLTSIATRNFLDKKRAGTKVSLAAFMRRSAGNSFGIIVPQAQLTGYAYENQNGMAGETLPFKATGINEGARIAFW